MYTMSRLQFFILCLNYSIILCCRSQTTMEGYDMSKLLVNALCRFYASKAEKGLKVNKINNKSKESHQLMGPQF